MELERYIKGASSLVIMFYNIKTEANITKYQILLVLGNRYIVSTILSCILYFAIGEKRDYAFSAEFLGGVGERRHNKQNVF